MRAQKCEICGNNTMIFIIVPKRIIGDTSNLNQIRGIDEIPMCESCIEKIKKGLIKWD
ncbi:hypothetical protein V1226_25965 [Lachnospiraceae bacterium JLR.KK009]|jgi:hypothetical protein